MFFIGVKIEGGVGLGGTLHHESQEEVTFPHPKSGQGNCRDGDIADDGSVVGKFPERAINIADDRDAEDEVNPAKDRTLGGNIHD